MDHDHEDHGHGHHHSHGHGHAHGHHHAPANFDRAFVIGIVLNAGFVLAEVGAGLVTGSLALLADAGHNLSDVLSLVMAFVATRLALRPPSERRTYGLRKGTVLASLANAVLLLIAVGAIVTEAIHRFGSPAPVEPGPVILVALAGVVINTATAVLFMRGRNEDLNVRGAFLHMAADAAVSLSVVIGALLMAWNGQQWIDPLLSILIAVVIVLGAWGLLRESADLAMDAVPPGIDVRRVRGYLMAQPGVTEVHDLHVWAMSTTETALTAHLVRETASDPDGFLRSVSDGLAHRFRIGHATLQIETDPSMCRLAPDEVV